jgi:hypothetical protein
MAGVTKVHGQVDTAQFIGRDLFYKTYTKGAAITQDEMNELAQAVMLTSTIEVVGEFEAGVSTAVNMIISGADTDNTADALVTGFTGSDLAF